VTETVSYGLDLITNVKVDKANILDTDFVIPGIISSQQITKDLIEKVYDDVAYQTLVTIFLSLYRHIFTGIQVLSHDMTLK